MPFLQETMTRFTARGFPNFAKNLSDLALRAEDGVLLPSATTMPFSSLALTRHAADERS